MPKFVGQRLHLRSVIHVHADRDLMGEVVGQSVRAADRASGGDQSQLEPAGDDLVCQPVPQAVRRLAFEQLRAGRLRDRFAVGLGDVLSRVFEIPGPKRAVGGKTRGKR